MSSATEVGQAAAASAPSIALPRPISIRRGFIASGTSRFRSMCSRPFRPPPRGTHVVGELEAALEVAGGDAAVQVAAFSSVSALRPVTASWPSLTST